MFEIMALVLLSQQPFVPVAEGMASYYAVRENLTITASGEPLRDEIYSCAMLGGNFGDYYLVVAENGRSVICRLNDRGPFVKGRVIDLSRAAIRQLHATKGRLPVKVYRLGADPPARQKSGKH